MKHFLCVFPLCKCEFVALESGGEGVYLQVFVLTKHCLEFLNVVWWDGVGNVGVGGGGCFYLVIMLLRSNSR